MKRILLLFLLLFSISLTIYSEVKYEFRNNILYEDGKPATGMFELKHGKYRMSGEFLNGMPNGIFDGYFDNKRILTRDVYKKGKVLKQEVFYKNGSLLAKMSNGNFELYFDDGQPLISLNKSKKTAIVYHENGNPLMVIRNIESALYNENNEMLFKVKNEELIEIGATLKKLEDGSFEYIKNNKVIAKITADEESVSYLYSTGETLMKSNDDTKVVEIFFKNGNTFFKGDGNKFTFNYKDGKPLCELEGNVAKVYDSNGNNIINNFDIITNIKKVN